MALPSRRNSHRVLTGSAVKLGQQRDRASSENRLSLPWQNRALEYYDSIGELRYAAQFYARQLSRVRYYPALLRDDGSTQPIKEGLPLELLNVIQDPGGGRSQLQYAYGRLMFITGEGILFGADNQARGWRFLWKEEVKFEDEAAIRLDSQKKEIERGVGYRLWNPHPRSADEADSPMRAIQDVAEELIVLTKSVMSTATSRMINGIFFVPQELSPGGAEPLGDEDPENNPFLADLIEHFHGQIENHMAPEAKIPFLIEGPGEFGDQIRWIQVHDPQNDYLERDLRTEAIKRLALGLDMPPEALLGMTDANHWTAKQVQHDIWRAHGAPKAEQFADDLNEAYLRPALEEAGYAQAEQVVIAYDDSQVVISPDRTEDADRALDRLAIGFSGYRTLKGIPEEMAPTEEEKDFLTALKLRAPDLLDGGTDNLVPGERGPAASPNGNTPAEEGPSAPAPGREVSRPESRTAAAKVSGAADLALHRCRELAGIRIRHKNRDAAGGVPEAMVASVVGMQEIVRIGQDPMKLVSGGADGLRSLLCEWKFSEEQVGSLCQMLEVYAAKTLLEAEHPDLPSGLVAQIERALEVSRALESA